MFSIVKIKVIPAAHCCKGTIKAALWLQTIVLNIFIFLSSQLFGEEDPDQDVSPDTEDPELAGDAGKTALDGEAKADAIGGIERKSTRTWAEESGYNAQKLFNKVRKLRILAVGFRICSGRSCTALPCFPK